MEQTFKEALRQRRQQMVIHSYLYYHMGTSVVSDHQWQAWAEDLVVLQSRGDCNIGFYDKEFEDWDGATGMHLPQDAWVQNKVQHVLNAYTQVKGELPYD
jgi:hypothetical protein